MKYTSSVVAATAAIVASASLARADTASDIAECIQKYNCGTDVTCNAKCFPSAAPSEAEINATNNCISSVCSGESTYSGATEAECQVFCVNKYFLAGNPDDTSSSSKDGSSNSSDNNDDDENDSNSALGSNLNVAITVASGAAAAFLLL